MPLIAIVDDRASNLGIFAKLAATIDSAMDVKTFSDPKAALAWMKNATPDLVMTDYQMPQLDGADFVAAMRQIDHLVDVPCVVISAHDDRTFRLRALESGATDFLSSPVDHHEFITRARNLLTLRRHQLALADRAQALEDALTKWQQAQDPDSRHAQEMLAQSVEALPAAIHITDPAGHVLFINTSAARFWGLEPATCLGKPMADWMPAQTLVTHTALDRLVVKNGSTLSCFEEQVVDADGVVHTWLTTKTPLHDVRQQLVGVITTALDITDRKDQERQQRHLAHHDEVTGLPNTRVLRKKLSRAIVRGQRGVGAFALLLVHLDGLMAINSTQDPRGGDAQLRSVAARLKASLRTTDTLVHLGGNTFGVVQTDVNEPEDVVALAQRVLDGARGCGADETVPQAGPVAKASIGICTFPEDGQDAQSLLDQAERALLRAKAEDDHCFCFYKMDVQARVQARQSVEADLRQALTRGQFVLHYQPIVSLACQRVVGVEALLRWERPGVGLLTPAAFLARAEALGLGSDIGAWVLKTACTQAHTWHSRGLTPLRLAVNISPQLWHSRHLPDLVGRMVRQTGLDPKSLDLEVTPAMLLADPQAARADGQRLKDLGISLTLDDVGAGLNLVAFQPFPVDRLKLEAICADSVTDTAHESSSISSLVTLAHGLEMHVVAEGIETLQHLQRMQREGCDDVQGFYFGQPLPADALERVLLDAPDLIPMVA